MRPRLLIVLAALILPGVVLLPVWRLAGLGAGEDDVLYYFPSRQFFHDTIQAGRWPWLNPWTGLGRPYVADPQSAFFYPPTWLGAGLPPLIAYGASLWLHYSLALGGAYRLLRSQRLGRRAALLGGITFAFGGFLLAHRAHFTMQHAAAWAPWVFWAWRHYLLAPAGVKALARHRLVAVLFTTMQCLSGHAQIAALTAVGALVWLLAGHGRRTAMRTNGDPTIARVLLRLAVLGAFVTGLFAVQLVPTWSYVRLCTRVHNSYLDFTENSWNPISAIGWVLPMFFGQRTPNLFGQPYWGPSHQVEQFSYVGILPLLLAAAALGPGWRADSVRRGWGVLMIFSLLLALGIFGPVCPLLYWLPGSHLFRVPARALFLFNLAVAALAAVSLNDLARGVAIDPVRLRARLLGWTKRPGRAAALLVGLPLVIVVIGATILSGAARSAAWWAAVPWNPAIWVPLGLLGAGFWTLRAAMARWQRPTMLWLILAFTIVDLGIIGWTIDVPAGVRSPGELLSPRESAEWMATVRASRERLWVVGRRHGDTPGEYIRPVEKAVANTNVLARIPTLTDYGPLQPITYVQRFGFRAWGEAEHAAELLADTPWMERCGVGWVLLCDDDMSAPVDCELHTVTPQGWRLYRHTERGVLAFVDGAADAYVREVAGESPERIAIRFEFPDARSTGDLAESATWPRVVLPRLALPGWSATLDGTDLPVDVADSYLLAVRVPPGTNGTIELRYFPPGLARGAAISLGTLAILIVITVGPALYAAGQRRRKVQPGPSLASA